MDHKAQIHSEGKVTLESAVLDRSPFLTNRLPTKVYAENPLSSEDPIGKLELLHRLSNILLVSSHYVMGVKRPLHSNVRIEAIYELQFKIFIFCQREILTCSLFMMG